MRFGLDESIIEKIKMVFSTFPEVEEAVLYGSRAMGNYKAGSDIDLVLKGNQILHFTLNNIILKLDDLMLPYLFDISIFHKIDNSELIKHIERVGITFYSKVNEPLRKH